MQTILATKARTSFVTVRCSSQKTESPVTVARKAFEKKRSQTVKESFNKLLVVANTDVKEIGDFFKELDEIHKKELSTFFDKVKNKASDSQVEEENNDVENIFLQKD